MERKHCSRCRAEFECGRNEGACWCQALPNLPLTQLDSARDCLCPGCLAQAIEGSQDPSAIDSDHGQP